jgi:N-acetyl-anhydromuramyl-L-alanine amidase AmpD
MKITDKGILTPEGDGPPLSHVWSPRRCRLAAGAPVGVCWHYTAGLGCEAMTRRISRLDRGDQVSWHVLIGRDGRVWQSVPLTAGAWHVKKTASQSPEWATGGINRWLLGVELESIDGHMFSAAQVESAAALVAALDAWRPDWARSAYEHGHQDYDPVRRSDPGPVWRRELARILDGISAG